MLDELDNLVKNIKENYKEKDFKDDLNSLIKELKSIKKRRRIYFNK